MKFKRMLCLLTLLCLVVSALPGPGDSAKAETKYTITVDVTNQIVTVYDTGNITDSGIVRQMICSTGKNATPTPLGTYSLPKPHSIERKEWYYFSEFNCYAKWATRVVRGILFHSVLYTAKKKGPTKTSVRALGSKASHGCIRLRVEDAYWIAMNCPEGTTVTIFKGAKNEALRKTLKNKTYSRDETAYDQFGGTATAAKLSLSKGKKGAQVTELQNRLRALGYMSAAADGKFGNTTRNAVNSFRAAIGLKKTGKVDQALWDRLFADDAPVSTLATLVEGWQGPAVRVLQQALTDLKLFSGAVDGSFGADTREAVQKYQSSFNMAVNGAADTALQNDAIARAQSVKAQFGDTDYQMVVSTAEVTLATVQARSYTRMRATPSKKGKKLVKLYRNTRVKVLSDDGSAWVQIQAGGVSGYVERRFLNMFAGTENTVSYQPVADTVPEQTPAAEAFIPASEPDVAVAAPETVAEPLPDVAVAAPEMVTEPQPEAALAAPEAEGGMALAELMEDERAGEAPAEVGEPSPEGEAAGEAVEAPAEAQDQKPSPSGEGDEPSEAEEVVSPDETLSTGATQEEKASSVSPDGEPASPEGKPVEDEAPAPEEGRASEAETPAAPAQPLPRCAVTLTEGTNLYARPAEDAEVLTQLPANAALPVAGVDGGWIAVRYENGLAYLRAGDAALTDDAPEEPVPEDSAVSGDSTAEADGEPALEMGTEPAIEPEPASEGMDGTGLTFEDKQE